MNKDNKIGNENTLKNDNGKFLRTLSKERTETPVKLPFAEVVNPKNMELTFDPNETKNINLKCIGGSMVSRSVLYPKVGSSVQWYNLRHISDEIANATQNWKGIKVYVKVILQNRKISVQIIPTAAALIIKALKEPIQQENRKQNIVENKNIRLEDIINAARIMRPRSESKHFSGVMKEILGTAQIIGCKIDGKCPHDLIVSINNGSLNCPLE